jgi:hypothetical protein
LRLVKRAKAGIIDQAEAHGDSDIEHTLLIGQNVLIRLVVPSDFRKFVRRPEIGAGRKLDFANQMSFASRIIRFEMRKVDNAQCIPIVLPRKLTLSEIFL